MRQQHEYIEVEEQQPAPARRGSARVPHPGRDDLTGEDQAQRRRLITTIIIVALLGLLSALIVGWSIFGPKRGAGAGVGAPQASSPGDSRSTAQGALGPVTIIDTEIVGTEQDKLTFGNRLPFAIPNAQGIEVEGGGWSNGRAAFKPGEAAGIQRLFEPDGEVWVLVEVDPSNKKSYLGRSVAMAERVVPPYLIVDGVQGPVPALGFMYSDAQQRVVSLEPLLGMRGLAEAPELSAARGDQKLWLLFRAPKGASIRSLWFGKKKATEWNPPVPVP